MKTVVKASQEISYEAPTEDHRRFQLLISPLLSGTRQVAAGHLLLPPGSAQGSAESHPETEEIYYCARGQGKLMLDGVEHPLEEGTVAYVGFDVPHQVFNTGDEDLLMIWFESPPSCQDDEYKPMKLGWKQVAGLTNA